MTMSAHMPAFKTPRSARRMVWAGSAVNLRIASGRVRRWSSRTYLRRMRGKGPVGPRMRLTRNHGEAFALGRCQLLHLLQRVGEGLDGADDDLLRA